MMKDKMYIPGSVNDAPLVLTMTRSSTYQSQSQVEAKTEFREILSDYFLFQRPCILRACCRPFRVIGLAFYACAPTFTGKCGS